MTQTLATALKVFAMVISIQSGDTITVSIDGKEQQVVLAGIDAPETGQPYAEESQKALEAKIKGKKVFIQVFGKNGDNLDSAAVWLDKRSINKEMVAEGYAWHDPKCPEYKSIAKAQEAAKEVKLGLWAEENPTPPWKYDAKKDATPADAKAKDPKDKNNSSISKSKLAEAQELANDDGKPKSFKSFPQGFAVMFKSPEGDWYLTSVRIHGRRYGLPQPPKEDFHVTLCDRDYKPIKDFAFPYSKFKRSAQSEWVTLKVPPTKIPAKKFVICVDFDAEATKGVYVSHDAEGEGLMGLPDKPSGYFSGGDWLIRATIQPDAPSKSDGKTNSR